VGCKRKGLKNRGGGLRNLRNLCDVMIALKATMNLILWPTPSASEGNKEHVARLCSVRSCALVLICGNNCCDCHARGLIMTCGAGAFTLYNALAAGTLHGCG
jgi:hypothetical protein